MSTERPKREFMSREEATFSNIWEIAVSCIVYVQQTDWMRNASK